MNFFFCSSHPHPIISEINGLLLQLETYKKNGSGLDLGLGSGISIDLSLWSSPLLIALERRLFITFQHAEQIAESAQLSKHDLQHLHSAILKLVLDYPINFTQPYFKDYFARGGRSQHPFLGHLHTFRLLLEARWKEKHQHINTIGFLIFQHVPEIMSTHSVDVEPAKKRAKVFALS